MPIYTYPELKGRIKVGDTVIHKGKKIDEPYTPRAEDRVRLEEDEKTDYHKNMQNYYDNKVAEYLADTPKPYVPRVGDRVRLEGVVRAIDKDGDATIRMAPNSNSGINILVFSSDFQQLTLISRAPRTIAKAEAEKMLSEKLGEDVTIE